MTDESITSSAGDDFGNDFITVWSEERGIDADAATKSHEIVFVDTAAEDYEDWSSTSSTTRIRLTRL